MGVSYPVQDAFGGSGSWFWRWHRRNGKWGGFRVHALASVENRGGVIRIIGYSRNTDQGPRLDVYLSDAGQSFRVYLNDRELT
jgi:hypothetical protein